MIEIILILLFIILGFYLIYLQIRFNKYLKSTPYIKKDYNYFSKWDSFDYKNFYNFYQLDRTSLHYESFDKNEFDKILYINYKIFIFLLFIEVLIILILQFL